MQIQARKLFTLPTQLALMERVGDYINKDVDENELIAQAMAGFGLDRVLRFDVGKNTDGFSPLVRETIEATDMERMAVHHLIEYPDNHYRLLKKWISDFYAVKPEWFVLSAGLEPMIDMISRVFLSQGDRYLLPVPNFFHFEEYSNRMGAVAIMVQLSEENRYRWNTSITAELLNAITNYVPKLIWISNPGNPTGQYLPLDIIDEIVTRAEEHSVFVVVDEAYGEYTDNPAVKTSACSLVHEHDNLMVLRTFSKIYGLPSLRVGYLVSSSKDILNAVTMYRPMFPFSWFSLYVAQIASLDQDFVAESRELVASRRTAIYEALSGLRGFDVVPSETNIFLMSHGSLNADELCGELLKRGILVANHGGITGLTPGRYVRVTVRCEEDNAEFVRACADIDCMTS
jgi:histidinol-phosphate aminotransferase